MKKVSIVMCTYNGAKYLAPQLDSILAQTYPLWEILIQDDGSTDATCDIVEDYQKRFPVIRLIRNPQNLGYNLNFLTAISRATGYYVAISDQDDIWEPTSCTCWKPIRTRKHASAAARNSVTNTTSSLTGTPGGRITAWNA